LTPEQLQRLREQLPIFGEKVSPAAKFETFCRYYGIDFEARDPRLSHVAGYIPSGDHTLAVHYWYQKNARSNLLLLHGYFDHTGLFNKLIEWGLAQQCNVLIFDLPGHGLSSGEPAVIDDFADYSRAIKDVLGAVSLPPLPLWVMAQSTGCAALIEYARKYDWPFAATVLLAPLIRPANWPLVAAGHFVLGHFINGIKRSFSVNSSDGDFLAFLQRDPLQSHQISLQWVGALRRWLQHLPRRDLGVGPALIIQGDADATVDWRYNVGFVEKLFPGSRVDYLHGAGHQLANESAQFRHDYLAHVIDWLGKNGIELNSTSGIEPG
jgi:alpha-beta hydrolase superfamily lysophospholipase